MSDLSPEDVDDYTHGRLAADDPEVIRMLAAALSVARREVGWHVSPVRLVDEITLDGPGSRVLWLPTLKLVQLVSISEDDVDLDLATVKQSAGDGPGLPRRVALRKTSKACWTDEYSGISLVIDHGFDEDEAADWRQAILTMVDQMSLVPVSGGTGVSEFGLAGKRVDDVDYRYSPYAAMATEVLFSVNDILDDYRLPELDYL